jgi:hypothetical protein
VEEKMWVWVYLSVVKGLRFDPGKGFLPEKQKKQGKLKLVIF